MWALMIAFSNSLLSSLNNENHKRDGGLGTLNQHRFWLFNSFVFSVFNDLV